MRHTKPGGSALTVAVKKLAIVGGFDAAHIGGSFVRAAADMPLDMLTFNVGEAWSGSRLHRALSWRLADRKPPRLRDFSKKVADTCERVRPDVLIATGAAPLRAQELRRLRAIGVACVNYSTDDPWNRVSRARWFLQALPEYDVVLTTRRSNIDDLRALGCRHVRYLPFGFDEYIHLPATPPYLLPAHDILFVGGADYDRVQFVKELLGVGCKPALVGAYWERWGATRPYALGSRSPQEITQITASAKVNLCLVRRANRDGHVMRTFEIAAIGGCMLVEDTLEHREIFGDDGVRVRYFSTPLEAAERARDLLGDGFERARLTTAARAHIAIVGKNTYGDRLISILDAAGHVGLS